MMKLTQTAVDTVVKPQLLTVGNAHKNSERMKMLSDKVKKMISDEVMSTFVVNLDNDGYLPVSEGGELLITVFDNKICRLAWRPNSWSTWGPPVEAEKRN